MTISETLNVLKNHRLFQSRRLKSLLWEKIFAWNSWTPRGLSCPDQAYDVMTTKLWQSRLTGPAKSGAGRGGAGRGEREREGQGEGAEQGGWRGGGSAREERRQGTLSTAGEGPPHSRQIIQNGPAFEETLHENEGRARLRGE